MKVDLSIIILNYNTKEFLKKCLQSIEVSNVGNLSVEVIVVDNHSTDGSVQEIKNLKFKIQDDKSKLKIIENKKNVGFSRGNNIGVRKTKGRYVLFLNPDTVLPRNALKMMFEFMEGHLDVGVASPRLELADRSLDEASHRGFPTPWNAFCHFSGLRSLFPQSRLFAGYTMGWLLEETAPHEVDSVTGAFLFTRRQVGEKIGWWDEDYFWYGEDLDFCYKVKQAGWKVMFLPQISTLHYRGVSSGIKKHSRELATSNPETRQKATLASTEAMRVFYRKHYMDKYPRVVTWVVLAGIDIFERIRLWRVAI